MRGSASAPTDTDPEHAASKSGTQHYQGGKPGSISTDVDKLESAPFFSERQAQARRRDEPVMCAHCQRTVRRKSRQQRFCSRRCRVSAHRAKAALEQIRIRPRYPHGLSETNARKKAGISNGLRERFSGSTPHIFGPARVIETEVYGGRNWRSVVSSDGVTVEIARLRPRALITEQSNTEQSAFKKHGEPSACQGSSGSVETQE